MHVRGKIHGHHPAWAPADFNAKSVGGSCDTAPLLCQRLPLVQAPCLFGRAVGLPVCATASRRLSPARGRAARISKAVRLVTAVPPCSPGLGESEDPPIPHHRQPSTCRCVCQGSVRNNVSLSDYWRCNPGQESERRRLGPQHGQRSGVPRIESTKCGDTLVS